MRNFYCNILLLLVAIASPATALLRTRTHHQGTSLSHKKLRWRNSRISSTSTPINTALHSNDFNFAGTLCTEPADLTPAVDKFMRLPTGPSSSSSSSENSRDSVTAKGPAPNDLDPFKMVGGELQSLSQYVKDLMESENPVLTLAATHFFEKRQGKRFRPTIVALMAHALHPSQTADYSGSKLQEKVLSLAQITEMIHVASLIHDDVLDEADTRRGGSSVHSMYSNKVAVLAGDYLLARASVLLARLQHFQVVEVMASALDALVQGEIMQARSKKTDALDMDYYLRKTYFKTASLICNSCRSTALLCGYSEQQEQTLAAEKFGYHLGMAFQIVDDILDFTGASADLGKPAQADMQLGLATAPILFASRENKLIEPLIVRKFKEAGDVQKAVRLATETNCVQQSYDLAEFHAKQAVEALNQLPPSDYSNALLKLLYVAISRDK